jgi:hypothetical protein
VSTVTVRVYEAGAGTSLYVIGTDRIIEAARHLPPEVTSWGGSLPGLFARRQGRWKAVSESRPPKDARPSVCFTSVKRP